MKVGDNVIHPPRDQLIGRFKTTVEIPMVITFFRVWIKYSESEVYEQFCSPYQSVSDFLKEKKVPSARLGKQLLISGQMGWFKTTQNNPIVFFCQIWIKHNEMEACQQTCLCQSIGEFVKQNRGSRVMLGDQIMHPEDTRMLTDLETTNENPVCVSDRLRIPVTYRGNTARYTVEVTKTIQEFLETNFGSATFAHVNKLTLNTNDVFMNRPFDENHGFVVENRMVTIYTQHVKEPKEVNLTSCKTIRDVLNKLKANEAYSYCSNQYQLLKHDELLDHFIMNTQHDCCIFIMLSPMPVTFELSQSVSGAAKKDSGKEIFNHTVSYGRYSHYLAVKIYNRWVYQSQYDSVVENFQAILSCDQHKIFLSNETFYTSMLSREFDKFLNDDVGCFHQISIKHAKRGAVGESLPDFYFAQVDEHGIPTRTLLAADFKKEDTDSAYTTAEAESFGYCLDVLHHTKSFKPILAIPGTKKKLVLYLCLAIGGPNANLATIKIGEAKVEDSQEMNCFFSALKYAVQCITDTDYNSRFVVEPAEGLKLELSLNSSNRVFLSSEKVYKLYDENLLKPNIEMMEIIACGYFPMEKVPLSADKTLTYYRSSFIKQKEHRCLQLDDFKPIMEALDKLHTAKYVHSDVRIANLIFPFDDEEAKLIDFDLADKIDTPYPQYYNKIHERHPEATIGAHRKIVHDHYSIIQIIERLPFYCNLTTEQKQKLEAVKNNDTISLCSVF